MKLTRVAAALALSGANIVSATTTSAGPPCSSAQVTAAYLALSGLLNSFELFDCGIDMGLSLLYTTVLPTEAQYAVMCILPSCQELVQLVIQANPPNCVLTIPTSGMAINVNALANAFDATCDAILGTEAPITEAPVTDAPTTDSPVVLEPVTEEPATDIPVDEDPVTDIPTTADPVAGIPVTEDPVTEDPTAEDPTTEDPVIKEPATEDPVTAEPATAEPATDIPVTEEPLTEGSTTEPATDVAMTDAPVVTTSAPLCGW